MKKCFSVIYQRGAETVPYRQTVAKNCNTVAETAHLQSEITPSEIDAIPTVSPRHTGRTSGR